MITKTSTPENDLLHVTAVDEAQKSASRLYYKILLRYARKQRSGGGSDAANAEKRKVLSQAKRDLRACLKRMQKVKRAGKRLNSQKATMLRLYYIVVHDPKVASPELLVTAADLLMRYLAISQRIAVLTAKGAKVKAARVVRGVTREEYIALKKHLCELRGLKPAAATPAA
jgi:hypothetical protein